MTQTYLGDVEREAKLFVYYVFEDYAGRQQAFTERVQQELESLGGLYKSSVSLLFPNPRYAASIQSELREIGDLWWTMQGKLPGLLICPRPLNQFNSNAGDHALLSFSHSTPEEAAATVNRARQLLDNQLSWMHANPPQVAAAPLWKRFFDALELKPGVAGVRLDLKKLKR